CCPPDPVGATVPGRPRAGARARRVALRRPRAGPDVPALRGGVRRHRRHRSCRRLLERDGRPARQPRAAVTSRSGAAGLHARLARRGVGPGEEVVTSSFSFVASANVILFQHATPVFADIDEQTSNVDPAAVEAAITPRTKAILPVHIFGYPCDIGAINAIAERHGLPVVEEAGEGLA